MSKPRTVPKRQLRLESQLAQWAAKNRWSLPSGKVAVTVENPLTAADLADIDFDCTDDDSECLD